MSANLARPIINDLIAKDCRPQTHYLIFLSETRASHVNEFEGHFIITNAKTSEIAFTYTTLQKYIFIYRLSQDIN